MRNARLALALVATVAMATMTGPGPANAATAEQEQAFLDTYRTAFDAEDADMLRSLMFSEGAIPEALELYEMLMTAEFGRKIASIELQELDAEDLARVEETMPMPDGTMARLAPPPYKKIVIVIDTTDDSGSGTSTSRAYVAEHDGRLGIAVPVPAN